VTAAPRTYVPGTDERAAALALGRAFQRDPSVEYMLGAEPRIAPVTWLLRQGLRASQAEAGGGATRVVDDADGRIAAVAAWIPPDRDPIPSFLRHMRLGGWALPWRAGPAVLPRVLRRDEDAARRYRADLRQPEWVLDLLGVDPGAQGTGLGRMLVADGLARAAADGVPAYLQTYRIENVAWYRTLGFAVVSEVSHADVPQGWGMRWTPPA
jgi:GNAT superfamily N-acetyltransferase